MDFSTFTQIAWNQALYFLKELNQYNLLQRLLVIGIYLLLAKLADLFIDKLLKRLAASTPFATDDKIISILHKPIQGSIILLGLMHALTLPPDLPSPWSTVLPNLIKTLTLILWWGAFIKEIYHLNEINLAEWLEKRNIGRDIFYLVRNISLVLVIFAGILWGLLIWDVNLTPLFASAGIAGITVALAAKDTMANFFGGISVFADRAYKVGDYIILDATERGEVMEVGIRSTKIRTRDDVMITIPNSIMANSKIVNESAPQPRFRIRIDVGVAYDSDLRLVERTLLEVAKANTALAEKPEPRVRVRSFGESSINFQLLVWVRDPSMKGLETHNLLKMIHSTFRNKGITIPFPQRDIHIKGQEGSSITEAE
ncbi:mechanosensitive ion channel family protein [Desulfolithobacter sp.]